MATANGVPVPPDAVVEVGFAGLDGFVDVVARLGAAGLVPLDPAKLSRSGLEAAGIAGPVVVAARPTGGRVIVARLVDAARLQAALALTLGDAGVRLQRKVGQVDAVVGMDNGAGNDVVALVRAGNGLVVVVLEPVDVLAEASFVEALATGALSSPTRVPKAIDLHTAPTTAFGGIVDGPVDGVVTVGDDGIKIAATVKLTAEGRPLWRALSTPSPSTACAVEEGAFLSVRLPPVPGLEEDLGAVGLGDVARLDAFAGRLVIGLHGVAAGTPADRDDIPSLVAIAVTATPSLAGKAGLQQSIDEAFGGAGTLRPVGARKVRTVDNVQRPWRSVAAVVDDDVFALGVGAVVPVDKVAVGISCPAEPGRLLTVEGAGVVRAIERAEPGLALLRRFGSIAGLGGGLAGGDPLSTVAAIERLEVDATPVSGSEAVDVLIHMQLRARK